ncbi:MAG: hypothetical protein A2287_04705 [Candidatus Melainabacteria bacterium RIFOXYA12_FULL_32_12]|nr:MAG: hypothetical protein A2287_04705 [Candidatus Melainabacteria bacterium RIFOXYA12_FULL_32_12]
METQEIMKKLQAPFEACEIEWRAQSQGASQDGKPWIMVLAYVEARAIQNRLDEIFGFDGWQDEYRAVGNNIICRLSVKVNDNWVYKENGASETQVEAFKGGISGSFKRVAASGYGIGRYLYNLETAFAEVSKEKPSNMSAWNKSYIKEKNLTFWWKTPDLPNWALPGGNGSKSSSTTQKQSKPESVNTQSQDILNCEICNEKITEKVASFSMKYHNRKLCMKCQDLVKQAS